ncbi:RNA recognition domain-containing protein [Diaporthe helianthi]|uniref:RNA recognition domain-containing protein n=1 Tax=Diaporthe helianthi TaxID=158607 RepID=A0A2P5HMP6_DIAHE|nr:RNA recognition domain-containing protein [Diaporthe helianthi]
MSGKLDQSLDEILSTNKRTPAGGRRSTRKTARPAAAAPVGGVKKNTKPARGAAAKPSSGRASKPPGESKIIVSNLPKDVSESQIKEYFQTAVAGVKKAELVYGPGGSSRGIANVVFHHSDGASKAYQKLNGLLIDNRPIRVEVVVTGELVPAPPTLSQRVSQPKATPKSAAADKASGAGRGVKPAAGSRGGAAGKRGRGGRAKSARPTKKTADELDAEMADYFDSAKSGGEAAATGATNGDAAMEDEVL